MPNSQQYSRNTKKSLKASITNQGNGGGNKKSGLISSTGGRPGISLFRAGSSKQQRETVSCVNQIGGIGRGKHQTKAPADGVHRASSACSSKKHDTVNKAHFNAQNPESHKVKFSLFQESKDSSVGVTYIPNEAEIDKFVQEIHSENKREYFATWKKHNGTIVNNIAAFLEKAQVEDGMRQLVSIFNTYGGSNVFAALENETIKYNNEVRTNRTPKLGIDLGIDSGLKDNIYLGLDDTFDSLENLTINAGTEIAGQIYCLNSDNILYGEKYVDTVNDFNIKWDKSQFDLIHGSEDKIYINEAEGTLPSISGGITISKLGSLYGLYNTLINQLQDDLENKLISLKDNTPKTHGAIINVTKTNKKLQLNIDDENCYLLREPEFKDLKNNLLPLKTRKSERILNNGVFPPNVGISKNEETQAYIPGVSSAHDGVKDVFDATTSLALFGLSTPTYQGVNSLYENSSAGTILKKGIEDTILKNQTLVETTSFKLSHSDSARNYYPIHTEINFSGEIATLKKVRNIEKQIEQRPEGTRVNYEATKIEVKNVKSSQLTFWEKLITNEGINSKNITSLEVQYKLLLVGDNLDGFLISPGADNAKLPFAPAVNIINFLQLVQGATPTTGYATDEVVKDVVLRLAPPSTPGEPDYPSLDLSEESEVDVPTVNKTSLKIYKYKYAKYIEFRKIFIDIYKYYVNLGTAQLAAASAASAANPNNVFGKIIPNLIILLGDTATATFNVKYTTFTTGAFLIEYTNRIDSSDLITDATTTMQAASARSYPNSATKQDNIFWSNRYVLGSNLTLQEKDALRSVETELLGLYYKYVRSILIFNDIQERRIILFEDQLSLLNSQKDYFINEGLIPLNRAAAMTTDDIKTIVSNTFDADSAIVKTLGDHSLRNQFPHLATDILNVAQIYDNSEVVTANTLSSFGFSLELILSSIIVSQPHEGEIMKLMLQVSNDCGIALEEVWRDVYNYSYTITNCNNDDYEPDNPSAWRLENDKFLLYKYVKKSDESEMMWTDAARKALTKTRTTGIIYIPGITNPLSDVDYSSELNDFALARNYITTPPPAFVSGYKQTEYKVIEKLMQLVDGSLDILHKEFDDKLKERKNKQTDLESKQELLYTKGVEHETAKVNENKAKSTKKAIEDEIDDATNDGTIGTKNSSLVQRLADANSVLSAATLATTAATTAAATAATAATTAAATVATAATAESAAKDKRDLVFLGWNVEKETSILLLKDNAEQELKYYCKNGLYAFRKSSNVLMPTSDLSPLQFETLTKVESGSTPVHTLANVADSVMRIFKLKQDDINITVISNTVKQQKTSDPLVGAAGKEYYLQKLVSVDSQGRVLESRTIYRKEPPAPATDAEELEINDWNNAYRSGYYNVLDVPTKTGIYNNDIQELLIPKDLKINFLHPDVVKFLIGGNLAEKILKPNETEKRNKYISVMVLTKAIADATSSGNTGLVAQNTDNRNNLLRNLKFVSPSSPGGGVPPLGTFYSAAEILQHLAVVKAALIADNYKPEQFKEPIYDSTANEFTKNIDIANIVKQSITYQYGKSADFYVYTPPSVRSIPTPPAEVLGVTSSIYTTKKLYVFGSYNAKDSKIQTAGSQPFTLAQSNSIYLGFNYKGLKTAAEATGDNTVLTSLNKQDEYYILGLNGEIIKNSATEHDGHYYYPNHVNFMRNNFFGTGTTSFWADATTSTIITLIRSKIQDWLRVGSIIPTNQTAGAAVISLFPNPTPVTGTTSVSAQNLVSYQYAYCERDNIIVNNEAIALKTTAAHSPFSFTSPSLRWLAPPSPHVRTNLDKFLVDSMRYKIIGKVSEWIHTEKSKIETYLRPKSETTKQFTNNVVKMKNNMFALFDYRPFNFKSSSYEISVSMCRIVSLTLKIFYNERILALNSKLKSFVQIINAYRTTSIDKSAEVSLKYDIMVGFYLKLTGQISKQISLLKILLNHENYYCPIKKNESAQENFTITNINQDPVQVAILESELIISFLNSTKIGIESSSYEVVKKEDRKDNVNFISSDIMQGGTDHNILGMPWLDVNYKDGFDKNKAPSDKIAGRVNRVVGDDDINHGKSNMPNLSTLLMIDFGKAPAANTPDVFTESKFKDADAKINIQNIDTALITGTAAEKQAAAEQILKLKGNAKMFKIASSTPPQTDAIVKVHVAAVAAWELANQATEDARFDDMVTAHNQFHRYDPAADGAPVLAEINALRGDIDKKVNLVKSYGYSIRGIKYNPDGTAPKSATDYKEIFPSTSYPAINNIESGLNFIYEETETETSVTLDPRYPVIGSVAFLELENPLELIEKLELFAPVDNDGELFEGEFSDASIEGELDNKLRKVIEETSGEVGNLAYIENRLSYFQEYLVVVKYKAEYNSFGTCIQELYNWGENNGITRKTDNATVYNRPNFSNICDDKGPTEFLKNIMKLVTDRLNNLRSGTDSFKGADFSSLAEFYNSLGEFASEIQNEKIQNHGAYVNVQCPQNLYTGVKGNENTDSGKILPIYVDVDVDGPFAEKGGKINHYLNIKAETSDTSESTKKKTASITDISISPPVPSSNL